MTATVTSDKGSAVRVLSYPMAADLGLLLIRVMVGVVGLVHGSQKLFGVLGGPGIKGFTGFLETLKVPAPTVSAWAAALAEFVGGALIALGIFPRLAAIPFAVVMFTAFATAHKGRFIGEGNGELPFTLGVVLVGLILTGPGRLTLQRLVKRK